MSTRRFAARDLTAAGALVVLCLAGCQAWHAQSPVADAVAAKPNQMRTTTVDGARLLLEAPRIVGDSVIAFEWEEGLGGHRIALHLDSIDRVEFLEFDALRSSVFGLGLGALLVISLLSGDQ